MRLRKYVASLLALAALAPAAAVEARQQVFQVDPTHSHLEFTVSDALHTVKGTFKIQSGVVRVNPANGAATGQILVDAKSGDSGSHMRDRRMHKQILESDKYPEIAFAPSRIEGQIAPAGDSKISITGVFTIHGAGHPLTTTALVHREGNQFKASVTFSVPYVKWGMKDPSNFLIKVKDEVRITLDLTGTVSDEAAASQ